MKNEFITKFLELSKEFLDITHPLVVGPNKYKNGFSEILEGVFRKDYLTMQTIIFLMDKIENDGQFQIIFAGSIQDLSRRVLEDMIYMEYINGRDKIKYSKIFHNFEIIEGKQELEFLLRYGAKIDEKTKDTINEKYKKAPSELKDDRHNWSAKSFEKILKWLVENNFMNETDRENFLTFYVLGNRKNHTSPIDILSHSSEEALLSASTQDLGIGLAVTCFASLRVALLLAQEIKNSGQIIKKIETLFIKLAS